MGMKYLSFSVDIKCTASVYLRCLNFGFRISLWLLYICSNAGPIYWTWSHFNVSLTSTLAYLHSVELKFHVFPYLKPEPTSHKSVDLTQTEPQRATLYRPCSRHQPSKTLCLDLGHRYLSERFLNLGSVRCIKVHGWSRRIVNDGIRRLRFYYLWFNQRYLVKVSFGRCPPE